MNIIQVNKTIEQWYSHAMPLLGKKCYQAYHERRKRCEICPSHRTIQSSEAAYEIVPKRGPGGMIVGWLDLYSFPFVDSKTNQLKGVIEYVRDITERKRMEEAIYKEREFTSSLIEKMAEGFAVVDSEGVQILVNETLCKMTEYSKEELLNQKPPFKYWAEEGMKDINEAFKKTLKGVESDYELIFKRKAGERFIALVSPRKTVDPDGNTIFFAIIKDITERKRVENTLRESEERYRELVEKAGIGILIDDTEGNIKYANKMVAETYGYSQEEMKEQSIKSIVHPDEFERVMKIHSDRIKGEKVPSSYVYKGLSKDGSIKYFELDVTPFKKGETIIGTRVYIKDITERKKTEEERKELQAQLIQSTKMAGVGTLASGIAHEFNNLLQIMSGHVQIAQETKKTEDTEEAFDIVLSTTDRASKIIGDLLTFSRADEAKKELCSIKEPLESVLSMIEDQLKKNNIKIFRIYGRTSLLKVNKGEMQQVFLNMVANARDAMLPKGGRLEVGVRQEKGHVKVSFHDTGKGIKEEDIDKVFEPFYTTKGAAGGDAKIAGTGLGLYVSYGIVRRHGGMIEVESKRDGGATFTVSLPVKITGKRKKK